MLVPLWLCHHVPHHLLYEHSEPFTGHHLLDLQRCLFHLHASLPWSRGPMAKGGPKALLWCKIIYRVVFCNCSAQISVLKRKTLFNQRGSFVHREWNRISDWLPIVFHFGTENWEEQLKNPPCISEEPNMIIV